MSWVSTHLYYELLNVATAERVGIGHQPPILLKSFDYQAMFDLQVAGRDDEFVKELVKGAVDLESIGANGIAICANTVHKYFEEVQSAVSIPILHVADACGAAIQQAGFRVATLLGTKYTMESDFYRQRLQTKFGIQAIIPNDTDRDTIERVIRTELTRKVLSPESKAAYLEIIHRMAATGSQGTILGCTEIGLLINQTDTSHPLFDTTILHSNALVDWALA